MDFETLKKQLDISHGTLLITSETFSKQEANDLGFVSWLSKYYSGIYYPSGNSTIKITEASYDLSDPDTLDEIIVINGKSFYLNSNEVFTQARFSLDEKGNVKASFCYKLINSGIQTWKFSQSFPDMPSSFNFKTSLNHPQKPLLDYFTFKSAYFIVSTIDIDGFVVSSNDLKANIKKGQNFVSIVDHQNTAINSIVSWLGLSTDRVKLYGTIQASNNNKLTELPTGTFPWEMNTTLPGLMLKASIPNLEIPIISLKDCELNIYSPIDKKWLFSNLTYQPVIGYSGVFKQDIKFTCELLVGVNELLISSKKLATVQKGDIEVMFNKKIDDLKIPDFVKSAGLVLEENLEIEAIAVDIVLGSDLKPTIPYVFVKTGILKNPLSLMESIKIDNVSATFIVSPFGSKYSSVTLEGELKIGQVPLELTSEYPSFFLQAELKEGQTIPLGTFLNQYLPEAISLGDVPIDYAVFNCVPNDYYSFTVVVAQDKPWYITIASKQIAFSNISLSLGYTQSPKNKSGSFTGTINIANFNLTATYDVPGDVVIRAQLPDINIVAFINSLVAELELTQLSLPDGFVLDLKNTSVMISKEQDTDYSFAIATEIDPFGSFIFCVTKHNNNKGFAFGFNIDSSKLNNLPGLEILEKISSAFGIDNVALICSSIDLPTGYTFPDLASFKNPLIKSQQINLPNSISGDKGITLYASVDLSKGLPGVIGKFLNIGSARLSLSFHLEMDFRGGDIVVTLPGEIKINKAAFKASITDAQLGGKFQLNQSPSIWVQGTLTTLINNSDIKFNIMLVLVPTGALLSGSALGTLDFSTFKLSNLGILVGIDDVGLPSFGFSAQIDTRNFDSSIAFFLNSTDPSKSVFLGAVTNITLANIVGALSGASIPGHLNKILDKFSINGIDDFNLDSSIIDALNNKDTKSSSKAVSEIFKKAQISLSDPFIVSMSDTKWSVTDLSTQTHYLVTSSNGQVKGKLEAQLYFAPQTVTLGNLPAFNQGFHIYGELDSDLKIFTVKDKLQVEIEQGKGIFIDSQLSPINLPVGNVTLLSITDPNDSQKGPSISLCTYHRTGADGQVVLPHFNLYGQIRVIDLIGDNVSIDISNNGFHFKCEANNPISKFTVLANFNDLNNLEISVTSFIGINKTILNNININTGIQATIEIKYNNQNLDIKAFGEFDFQGNHFQIASFDLEISDSLFDGIKDVFTKQAVQIVTDFVNGCPVTHAAILIADPTSMQPHSIVNKLYTVPHGEVLMYHLHRNKDELKNLILNNTNALVKAYVVKHLSPDNRRGHVTLIIEILDLIYPSASNTLKQSIDRVMPILEQGYGTNLNEFLDRNIQAG